MGVEMEKIKVLFVGLGGIGQRHLRNIVLLLGNNLEIYALRKKNRQIVLDDDLKIVEKETLNEKYNIVCVSTVEEAYDKGVNIVFICNPTSLHKEILLRAMKLKCYIFIEKPISDNLEGIERLLSQEDQTKRVFVGYQNRYHPCIKQAKKCIDSEAIGRILSVQIVVGECVRKWHKYEDYSKLYACRKDLGGGVVLTQIHELDYLYYFFGRPQSVYAIGGKLSDMPIDVEDVVSVLMRYKTPDGEFPVTINEDYLQNPSRRYCRILGTKGKIEFSLIEGTFYLYNYDGEIVINKKYSFNRNDMFIDEMKDFLYMVNGGNSKITLKDGVESLKIALMIKKSIESQQIICS